MHIGGFNFLQQNKATNAVESDVVSSSNGVLKEFNKNTATTTTSENFKVNKKYKYGHVNKSFEPSSAYALFECVEENQYENLKTLLEQKHLNVNALNNDGFSVLDLAVLLNSRQITKILLQHGAQTGNFPPENIESHLNALLAESEKKLSQINSSSTSSSGQISVGLESEKIIVERRIKLIRKMINGWQRLRAPDPPFSFTIDVVGTNSVLIKILEPIEETICTTFRVQYSPREDFSIVIAEKTISEWNIFQGTMGVNFLLDNLVQRRRYFFRACSGNLKGHGTYKISNPLSVVPSSWKDIEENPRDSLFLAQRDTLENIFKNVQHTRIDEPSCEDQRRKKKHAIKHLFTTVTKFQKSLRRGIHLACIIFSDEKILVTNEDFLPVIEIDETYPSNFNADFYWLMKISTSWEDAKNLRVEMEKNTSSKMQFRFKILNAIHQMQISLGITELGQFYYKPLKDSNGTMVLSCALYFKEPKASTLHTRWMSMSKLQKKVTQQLLDDSPINEILLNSIQSQISFYHASKVKLSRGLYLGYLKLFTSMDSIQIVCQAKNPNVLPNCKIRDNPHISAEEWSILKSNLERDKEGKLSQAQENFIESLKLSLNRLLKLMNIDYEDALRHRIYDTEVVELNEDVSFLIVCPSPCNDTIVSKDSSNDDLSIKRSDLITLPLITHEMIQFNTYQHSLLQKYARLSFLTEFDMITASMKRRQAFSNDEIQISKDKLKHLEETMSELNSTWKSVRWMTDLISFYRSKESGKLDIQKVLEFVSTYSIFFKMPDTLLRGFHVRSPVRGSWAGPQTFRGSEALTEHSKSEQLLNSIETQVAAVTSSTSTATAPEPSRKASIDSNYYSAGEQNEFQIPRLPTSKSEDTLVVVRKKGQTTSNSHQRKRPTSINPTISESSNKSNGLVVHRVTTQAITEHPTEVQKANSDLSPSKSKLRVSHHPKSSKKDIKKYHAEEESTLVTFLKPTLNAIQNEAHNQSFNRDPLIIVEDEAIEMISSPFRKTPLERSSRSDKNSTSNKSFGKSSKQFQWSDVHRKNVQSICQRKSEDSESPNWRAIDAFKQIEDSGETSTFNVTSESSDIESEIKEMLIERDYVNHDAIEANNNSSILQIYAAYDTGLAAGTSLKLKCTKKTTARELVDLVVKQLNMAVVLKGRDGPVYGANQLNDFCLVAVIGAGRERCFRDDFKPLDLQNPWKKGKLFVRFKQDLLAAIKINASNREAFSI